MKLDTLKLFIRPHFCNNLSEFVNIVGVFNNNNIQLYVNGVLVDQASASVGNAGSGTTVGYDSFFGNIDFSTFETDVPTQKITENSISESNPPLSLLKVTNFQFFLKYKVVIQKQNVDKRTTH